HLRRNLRAALQETRKAGEDHGEAQRRGAGPHRDARQAAMNPVRMPRRSRARTLVWAMAVAAASPSAVVATTLEASAAPSTHAATAAAHPGATARSRAQAAPVSTPVPPTAAKADSMIREGEAHFAHLWQLTF